MLNFTRAKKEERDLLLSLTSHTINGASAYSYLFTHGDCDEAAFFCGRNKEGEIKSLVFNDGDEFIRAYGDEFPDFLPLNEKCLMVYPGTECPRNDSRQITGTELLNVYRLLGGGRLSFDDERRYVLRLKNVNAGLSAVFGIFDDEGLASTAAVGAMNLKYGLIADVFTHPDFRCRGYASTVLRSCMAFILSNGRIPYLRCEEAMRPYYEKAGFIYYGKM